MKRKLLALAMWLAGTALAQPGQLLGPPQPTRTMQDSNLKPALPGALQGVGIDQKLDQQVSLDLKFKDEAGREVPLSTYFTTGKPVILALVYYRCPMLCTQILNGLAGSLAHYCARGTSQPSGFLRMRRRSPSSGTFVDQASWRQLPGPPCHDARTLRRQLRAIAHASPWCASGNSE